MAGRLQHVDEGAFADLEPENIGQKLCQPLE
jgi:hypothetical protein